MMESRRMTPAQRHRARVLAEQTAASAAPGGALHGSAYDLMLVKLAEDRRRLKSIQSIERKIEVKRGLLPEYQEWIDGALKAGRGAQDDVLMTVLVWHIDVGDYERALQIADYALAHRMALPDQYNRDLPTMLLDEFAGGYLNGPLADNPQQACVVLSRVGQMTQGADTPDQARAKLHKALAYALIAIVNLGCQDGDDGIAPSLLEYAEAANRNLHRALELHEAAGVKKDIERLERRLKKAVTG
ncbi:MAG: phage terminase small subunit [Burkholderiaceae bacterium]